MKRAFLLFLIMAGTGGAEVDRLLARRINSPVSAPMRYHGLHSTCIAYCLFAAIMSRLWICCLRTGVVLKGDIVLCVYCFIVDHLSVIFFKNTSRIRYSRASYLLLFFNF